MNEKDISLRTVEVTRSALTRALNNPMFLVAMAAHGVTPEDIELIVKDIMEYLDKTKSIHQYLLEEEEAENP